MPSRGEGESGGDDSLHRREETESRTPRLQPGSAGEHSMAPSAEMSSRGGDECSAGEHGVEPSAAAMEKGSEFVKVDGEAPRPCSAMLGKAQTVVLSSSGKDTLYRRAVAGGLDLDQKSQALRSKKARLAGVGSIFFGVSFSKFSVGEVDYMQKYKSLKKKYVESLECIANLKVIGGIASAFQRFDEETSKRIALGLEELACAIEDSLTNKRGPLVVKPLRKSNKLKEIKGICIKMYLVSPNATTHHSFEQRHINTHIQAEAMYNQGHFGGYNNPVKKLASCGVGPSYTTRLNAIIVCHEGPPVVTYSCLGYSLKPDGKVDNFLYISSTAHPQPNADATATCPPLLTKNQGVPPEQWLLRCIMMCCDAGLVILFSAKFSKIFRRGCDSKVRVILLSAKFSKFFSKYHLQKNVQLTACFLLSSNAKPFGIKSERGRNTFCFV
uniref:Uncharacterized protein n=1 Tax=Oryza punctata TaxID=4537 RepID=A0A0E0KEL5_ORYPU